MTSLRLAIGTDHGGFEAKNEVLEALKAKGFNVIDCGTCTSESTDYPIFAGRVSELVSRGVADVGVLICRSGIGMSMVANRFSGVRAALVTSPDTSRLSREHNNANVIVLGSDHMNYGFMELIEIFLETEFDHGGRHERRVNLINDLDQSDSELRKQVSDWADKKTTQ